MLALKVHKDLCVSVLRLNPNKAEFIVFNNKAQCEPLTSHSSLSIRGNPLHPANCVKNVCGSMHMLILYKLAVSMN